jgi:hypothetical protein
MWARAVPDLVLGGLFMLYNFNEIYFKNGLTTET